MATSFNLTVQHERQIVFAEKVLFHKSFGYAKKGEVIIYNNEIMKVSVAISQGSFSERYNLDFGPDWEVEFKK